nr:MAG TPA: hypothetical protein [Caudoviricetes sp.]
MEVPTTLNIFRSPLSAGGLVLYCLPTVLIITN